MTINTSRFENQQIVNSFNLFIDTEKANLIGDKSSHGDDVNIHLEQNSIEAGDGEIIKLSLSNFNMPKNFYDVDLNNGRFSIESTQLSTDKSGVLDLTHQNYVNIFDIAENLITQLAAYLTANHSTAQITKYVKLSNNTIANFNTTGRRILDITIQAQSSTNVAQNHSITKFNIQCQKAQGEAYLLFGGDRMDAPDTNFNSLRVTLAGSTIRVVGRYPMQRITDPYIYLRCGAVNSNLESAVLSNDDGKYNKDVINSNILAKIPKDVEFCNYEIKENEFFIKLQQRNLSTLRLFLTDSKGRKIGRKFRTHDQTAAGTGANQSTLGNLFFNATLRFDIIKTQNKHYLETKPLPPPLPARTAQSVLYGGEKFGEVKH